MKKVLCVFSVAALFGLSACTSMVMVAPSSTPITEKDTCIKIGPTEGRATGVTIFGLIPIGPQSPSRWARDSAIEKSGGNALIEVTQEYNVLNLLLLQFYWTKVDGIAVKVERKGAIKE